MAFRRPITTLGGLLWWTNLRQDLYFIMQEHHTGFPVWPYKYRILMRENRMEIANSNDIEEIELDWRYLQTHAIPRINEKIDLSKASNHLKSLSILEIVLSVVKTLI